MALSRTPIWALAGLALACGSDPTATPSSGGAASAGTAGATSSSGGSGGGNVCDPGPGYGEAQAGILIGSVTANVVDQNGEPVANLLVQVCGTDVCINGETGATGSAAVAPNVEIKKPAFKYGTGLDFARLAFLLGEEEVQELGTVTAIRLPSFAEGAPIAAGTESISNGVVLGLEPGTTVRHDVLVYTSAEERTFRAEPVPLPAAELEPSLELASLFALAPVETEFCPPARLALPNEHGWEAGRAIEFFALGVDIEEEWAPYAGWTKIGTGFVSEDGRRLELDGGLPILYAAIGVRQDP